MAAAAPLRARELNRATLARQALLEPASGSPAALVERVGSLQAQHPEWPPVALAARSADASTADLPAALQQRMVVRSSLMRITIHAVAARDFWPMFRVCQPLRITQWTLLTKVDPSSSELGTRLLAAHPAAVAALRERPMSSLDIDRLLSAEARNADVLPTILVDGFAAGTWELQRADRSVTVTLRPFRGLDREASVALMDEADRLLKLLAPAAESRTVDVAV